MSFQYKIRLMKKEDIPESLKLMTFHGMLLGIYELETWLELDPEGLLVAEELGTGRFLGQISGINYDSRNTFIGMFTVVDECRSNGIGTALWDALMPHCQHRNLGLYSREHMVHSYEKRGLVLKSDYGLKIYLGNPKIKKHDVDGIVMKKITRENIDKVNEYDRLVCGTDRSSYNLLNSTEKEAISLVAIDRSTQLAVGYIILQKANKYRIIAPLYADSDEIAELLISKCEIPQDEQIGVRTLDGSSGVDLMEKIGLNYVIQIPALFSNEIVLPDMKKVYSCTSVNFFPF